ncbi:MAG: hypothetical protein AB8E15_02105 [Bdellovibrionales bacterium]
MIYFIALTMLISLVISIIALRSFGKTLFIKPIMFLNEKYSAGALKLERKMKLAISLCMSCFGIFSFFLSSSYLIEFLSKLAA